MLLLYGMVTIYGCDNLIKKREKHFTLKWIEHAVYIIIKIYHSQFYKIIFIFIIRLLE